MGREIKRVPLDFNAPLDEVYEGYNPPENGVVHCPDCVSAEGRSTGYSRLGRSFYSLAERGSLLPVRASNLTPDEVAFMKALSKSVAPSYRSKKEIPYSHGGLDPITDDRMLCYDMMRHLQKTLKLPKKAFLCQTCKGTGSVVRDKELHAKAKRWRRKGPPKGKGWQVWETVTEGSPITPVFETAEELVDYLCRFGTVWDQKAIARGEDRLLPTREQAAAFVVGGWAPSALIVDGRMYANIQAAPLLRGSAQ